MPTNFSTIRPMSQSTISRMPAYTNANATPSGSSPVAPDNKKKKSHWFLKTLAAVAVLAGGAALLRGKVDAIKSFDTTASLASGASLKEKALHYGTNAIAVVGDFVIGKSIALYNWAKNLIPKSTTP